MNERYIKIERLRGCVGWRLGAAPRVWHRDLRAIPLSPSRTPAPDPVRAYHCRERSVYRAKDSTTGEFVALKVVPAHDDEGIPASALREVSLLRELVHPNIVRCACERGLRYPENEPCPTARACECAYLHTLARRRLRDVEFRSGVRVHLIFEIAPGGNLGDRISRARDDAAPIAVADMKVGGGVRATACVLQWKTAVPLHPSASERKRM